MKSAELGYHLAAKTLRRKGRAVTEVRRGFILGKNIVIPLSRPVFGHSRKTCVRQLFLDGTSSGKLRERRISREGLSKERDATGTWFSQCAV
jgi:hypothetical protein